MNDAFVITCEHGGYRIPSAYREWFVGWERQLDSHAGYDKGALLMARSLSAALDAPMLASTTSRLLIDLNRPPGHPRLYGPVTRKVSAELRAEIASRYHEPYWATLQRLVGLAVESGRRMIHISSHSFTPSLNARLRRADVGLLYDPGRRGEAELCARWKAAIEGCAPDLRVRRNYPYKGQAPGLTASMRLRFGTESYVGIELEVNQGIVLGPRPRWAELRGVLIRSFRAAHAAGCHCRTGQPAAIRARRASFESGPGGT